MEQFDKVLEEYKKALAPCGQLTCNFAPNITETMCKKTCAASESEIIGGGCRLANCEYTRYKAALMPMDADIEKQFIGPAIIGNCGHPKCTYVSEPILPPIHWDCPDPLPSGICRNPDCPYRSGVLKKGDKISSVKGPCGNAQCPYVIPAPCSVLNCPFRDLSKRNFRSNIERESKAKCPFANPPTTVNMMEICTNPNCEFKKQSLANIDKSSIELCSNPNCDFKKQFVGNVEKPSREICTNPNCEFKKQSLGNLEKPSICNSPNCPYRSLKPQCSNPECPFAKTAPSSLIGKTPSSVCSNPSCPKREQKQVTGICSSPNCPYAQQQESKTGSICSTPSCIAKKDAASSSIISWVCENPDCVYSKKKPESIESVRQACENPECPFNEPSLESCQNPECPFKKDSNATTDSGESCDNPDCPFKKGSKESELSECECDNPTCPAKRETCINPACPFNLRGYGPCTNPDCPNRITAMGRDLCFCATPEASFNEFCTDVTCKFHDPKLGKDDGDGKTGDASQQDGDVKVEGGVVEFTTGDRLSTYDMSPCTLTTCKFMGGNLKCVDCGVGPDGKKRGPCPRTCPGDPICPLATAKRAKRIQRRKDPTFRRTCVKMKRLCTHDHEYPGYHIGHKECVMPFFYVPGRMGWLWNIHTPCLNLKPRRGWRPGAVTKAVARMIAKHRASQSQNPHEAKKKLRKKNDEDDSSMICPKPTLEVKKREGIYHITMNPLKDPETVEMNENPYLDCTPLQFKVAKNNLLDPDILCHDEGEFYRSDSSSDDEIDIEVTTPAGIIHPDRPTQKKDVRVKQNQYDLNDLIAAQKNKNKDKEKEKEKEPEKEKTKGKGKKKKK